MERTKIDGERAHKISSVLLPGTPRGLAAGAPSRCETRAPSPARSHGAFAIRFGGRVYAYINRCAHIPTQLDWMEGEFFEASKLYLICSTHGAVYEPESGRCAGGPCRGRGLQPLAVSERDGHIYLHE